MVNICWLILRGSVRDSEQAGREFIKPNKAPVRKTVQLHSSTVNQERAMSEKAEWEYSTLIFMNHPFVVAELPDRQRSLLGAARYLNVEKCMRAFIDRNKVRPL